MISESVASAIALPGLPSLRDLEKVSLSVLRIYRPRTDWLALEIELHNHHKVKKKYKDIEKSAAVESDNEDVTQDNTRTIQAKCAFKAAMKRVILHDKRFTMFPPTESYPEEIPPKICGNLLQIEKMMGQFEDE